MHFTGAVNEKNRGKGKIMTSKTTLLCVFFPTLFIVYSASSTPITVVSAYWQIDKSKHRGSEYQKWINNFGAVDMDRLIFTSKEIRKTVFTHRGFYTANTFFNTSYNTPEQMIGARVYAMLKSMHWLDSEKERHGPELYAIWYLKWTCMSIAMNRFNSTFFIWHDIGAYRDEWTTMHWPSKRKQEQLMLMHDEQVLVGRITTKTYHFKHVNTISKLESVFRNADDIEGGFFGGRRKALEWFCSTYEVLFENMYKMHLFAGKDQTLMNILTRLYPSRFSIIDFTSSRCKQDVWFNFRIFLSDDATECFEEKKKSTISNFFNLNEVFKKYIF